MNSISPRHVLREWIGQSAVRLAAISSKGVGRAQIKLEEILMTENRKRGIKIVELKLKNNLR